MLGFALEKESGVQTHGYGLVSSRSEIAAALHEWHMALAAADASVEAEIYACAVALIMEILEPCATVHDLLDAYFCPGIAMLRLIAELCTGGEILLQPRVLLRATFAKRLRHLVGEAIA
jgi:hypothetical protein